MKMSRNAILLLALFAVFTGTLIYAAGELPDRVASHFGAHGEPNGWMSKQEDLIFMCLVGFGTPLFIMAVCYLTRYLPSWMVNLPHRHYWLAPERRSATADYLFAHSIWLACLMVGFMTCVHLLVILANKQTSPQLSTSLLLAVLFSFPAGMGIWAWRLFQHFRYPTMPQAREA